MMIKKKMGLVVNLNTGKHFDFLSTFPIQRETHPMVIQHRIASQKGTGKGFGTSATPKELKVVMDKLAFGYRTRRRRRSGTQQAIKMAN